MIENDLDDALESGDPAALEALLNEVDGVEDIDTDVDEVDVAASSNDSSTASSDTDNDGTDNVANSQEADEEPGRQVVKTKDGANEIPYEVLESTRNQLSAEKASKVELLSERDQLKADLAESQRLLEIRNSQLTEHDISPKDLPENYNLTAEQKAQIRDDYGDIGEAHIALMEKVDALTRQIDRPAATATATATASEDPVATAVNTAIESNADLSEWRLNNHEAFNTAVSIDQQLRADPAFADKSFDQRFAEVARRTRAFHGMAAREADVDLQTRANARIAAARPQTPTSLSDASNATTDLDKSPVLRLAESSPEEIADAMEDMTEAQIEALLSSVG